MYLLRNYLHTRVNVPFMIVAPTVQRSKLSLFLTCGCSQLCYYYSETDYSARENDNSIEQLLKYTIQFDRFNQFVNSRLFFFSQSKHMFLFYMSLMSIMFNNIVYPAMLRVVCALTYSCQIHFLIHV